MTELKEAEYLTLYPDVAAAVNSGVFKSGYDHYLKHGKAEGRAFTRQNSLESDLAKFLTIPPHDKNAFEIFSTTWKTIFDGMTQSNFDGTRDARIEWLFSKVNVDGFSILEQGV